ncbi:MAG TPA: S-methyl-5-thioribose-1-phosphate isomerase [Gemmatimonadaceae bacterium]|nr:S-methyl-5-thioribose-1-phosphate isomerase [Gemmatimonadaceae bacterium]
MSAGPDSAARIPGYVSLVQIIEAVRWSPDGDAVRIIDQRLLPGRLVERDLRTLDELCDAIATLAVRGAPAIGVAGAMGLVASLLQYADEPADAFASRAEAHAERIAPTRPTAVNLPWAMARMVRRLRALRSGNPRAGSADLLDALRAEADAVREEDRAMCRRIGEHGLPLIPDGARVLTHCNAGALATAGIGTALAPIYLAAESGRRVEVLVDETRPLLQGSRLTAWELTRAGIPVTVLADSMAAGLMRAGRVDLCIVGADRIAANGDVANKIGTYALAVAARHHGIPLYVAAPTSTFDPATPTGDAIEIEQRSPDEVRCAFGVATAPANVAVYNPAFDVTPADLVAAIISDRGVHRAPYSFE